jgi:hypothetical protein
MVRQGNGVVRWFGGSVILGLALVGTSGCAPAKGTVSGKVTLKDNGASVSPGSLVTFWSTDNHQFPGLVGTDGTYSVPDVPVGEMKVTVVPPSPLAQTFSHSRLPGAPEANPAIVPIPDKYRDPAKTQLKFTVQPGPNDFPIVLER